MKTRIIFLSILIIANFYSQNWVNNYTFPSGYDVTQMQFLNSNTGWVTLKSAQTVKFFKTTDKGKIWTELSTCWVNYYSSLTFFVFTGASVGYRSYTPGNGSYTILDKTTDGGYSWE